MYCLSDYLEALDSLGINVSAHGEVWGKRVTGKDDLLPLLMEGSYLIKPAEDGFLTETSSPTSFYITVEAPTTPELAFVISSGQEQKILSPLANKSGENDLYRTVRVVPTSKVRYGYTTKPKDNNLRIISVMNNIFRMFEVSISSRIFVRNENITPGSYHFLTVQEVYSGQLYLDDDLASIPHQEYPGYKHWASLQALVNEMVVKDHLPLEVTPRIKEMPEVTGNGIGRVLFFNTMRGYGKVLTASGVANLHWTNIQTTNRFPFVAAGQIVRFSNTLTNEKGVQLIGVDPV